MRAARRAEQRLQRGRPAKPDRYIQLSTWVPTGVFDRVVTRARRERKSLSAFIRELIVRDFPS